MALVVMDGDDCGSPELTESAHAVSASTAPSSVQPRATPIIFTATPVRCLEGTKDLDTVWHPVYLLQPPGSCIYALKVGFSAACVD